MKDKEAFIIIVCLVIYALTVYYIGRNTTSEKKAQEVTEKRLRELQEEVRYLRKTNLRLCEELGVEE